MTTLRRVALCLGIACSASLALFAVRQHSWTPRNSISVLAEAATSIPARRFSARLASPIPHRPKTEISRGVDVREDLRMRAVVSRTLSAAHGAGGHARGIDLLLIGEIAPSVEELRNAANDSRDPSVWNDLSCALLADGENNGSVISIVDDRTSTAGRQIVCFGTKSTTTSALEVFTLREEVRDWDRPLAEEHLDQLFARMCPLAVNGQICQQDTGLIRSKACYRAAALLDTQVPETLDPDPCF